MVEQTANEGTKGVPDLAGFAAQGWLHEGLLTKRDEPAVVFNHSASKEELLAWAYGQMDMAHKITTAGLNDESKEGSLIGVVDALLEPVLTALDAVVHQMKREASHG